MKKYSLLKVLAITFAIVALLSWVIPASVYSSGTWTSVGSTLPIGLYDLIILPVYTIVSFTQYGVLFLAIGGLYGVVNKTGVYASLVSNVVKKIKPKTFLIITTVLLSVLSSLTNLMPVLLILVPFFITVLLKHGYKKITAFTSTIGSILVGQIGTTYGFNIAGYLNYYLGLSMHTEIFTKIILLVIVTFLLIMIILKNEKNPSKKKEDIEIPLYEEVTKKKSNLPLIVISLVLIIFSLIGMYNWYNSFEFGFFGNLHESIIQFQIDGYPIFGNLLGDVAEIGFLSNYDLIAIITLFSLLIGWIYNLKLSDILDGFVNGMKSMLKPAFYAIISSVIFAFIYYNSSNGTFVNTILNTILGEEFKLPSIIASGGVLSFFYNDVTTLVSNNYTLFSTFDTNQLPIVAVLLQSIYGLVMLIAPTSIYLMASLAYLDISYKEWAKYIWKYLLIILGVIVVIGFIMVAFI